MTLLQSQDWQLIYELQESDEERDGLHTATFVATTLDLAKQLADERLGRLAPLAQPWFKDAGSYNPAYQPWTREVPGGRIARTDDPWGLREAALWQHITVVPLIGAPR